MTDDVAKALAGDQVIDITTIGRQSGQPRRIEIWFHRFERRYFITGSPGRPRSWYANLAAHPEFIFHLKGSVTADLPAKARPITERAEREKVFAGILPPLAGFPNAPGTDPALWINDSPLVEVTFEP
jgi:deazaflavin-dependent oxidoreductase (nitroreductase family)